MKQINVNLGERSYPIYIGCAILSEIGQIAKNHKLGKSIAVITDHTVKELYGEAVEKSLADANFNIKTYSVPAGESSKSLQVVESLIGDLIADGHNRETAIIALGGGVVGDLAGFVAATYLRGVSYVQVPTTLLADVDSSVGGKVGVNHPLGKNLIGAFLQPRFVLIDPDVLRTLDVREIGAGLAEVLKYGAIKNADFFDQVVHEIESLIQLSNTAFLISCIENCCRIKTEIVEKDEKESGERRILNFGHTIGHALEAATVYNYFRHGEAVAWGMQAAAYLSYVTGYLSEEQMQKVCAAVKQLNPPQIATTVTMPQILDNIGRDKKKTSSGLTWVLLRAIGKGFMTNVIDESHIQETIRWLQRI